MTDVVPIPPDLFARVAAFGVDVPVVLARAGLSATQTTFSTSEQMAFWSALAELAPNRDIGLQLGGNKKPEHLNLAELAALHAPTFDEGLKRLARYKRLVCAEEVIIGRDGRDGNEVRLGVHWIRATDPIPHLLTECIFAAVVNLVQNASNERFVPRRIELSRRRVSRVETELLKNHFGCPIEFDAPDDRMVFAASDLARPFRPRDPARYARLFPTLEAGLAKRALTFEDEVRSVMRKRMVGEQVTITRIARDLALTPRTLQRRLVKEGTGYGALLDEVRRTTAQRLLIATDLADAEIAFLLGFAELNSFTRAFRGWAGTTPRLWRRSAGRGARSA